MAQKTVILYPYEDTYINSGAGKRDDRYGSLGTLYAGFFDSIEEWHTYMKFRLPSDFSIANFVLAELEVFVSAFEGNYELYYLGIDPAEWAESTLTWNNSPTGSQFNPIGWYEPPSVGTGWRKIGHFSSAFEFGKAVFGSILSLAFSASELTWLMFHSRERSNYEPRLKLTYLVPDPGYSLSTDKSSYVRGETCIISYKAPETQGLAIRPKGYPAEGTQWIVEGAGTKTYTFTEADRLGGWGCVMWNGGEHGSLALVLGEVVQHQVEISSYSLPAEPLIGADAKFPCTVRNTGTADTEVQVFLFDRDTGAEVDHQPDLYWQDLAVGESFSFDGMFNTLHGTVPSATWKLRIEVRQQATPTVVDDYEEFSITATEKPSWFDSLVDTIGVLNFESISEPILDLFAGFDIPGWTEPPFTCMICGATFQDTWEYADHLVSHLTAFERGWFKK